MLLGAHISISKGYEHAVKEALSIEANTLQFFTRNPRGSAAKALNPVDINKMRELIKQTGFGPLVAHAPYTLNLASSKPEAREFSIRVLREDLERMSIVGASYMVLHPGSHAGLGLEKGIEKISSALKDVVTGNEKVMVLLELMAGSGTEVGYTFEQLYEIMDRTGNPDAFGVCFDTCHALGAGYDVIDSLDKVLLEFDKILGLSKLKVIHLNDSKFLLGSRKDRHANLGEGKLGLETIKNIINHPELKDKPFLLETPGGMENYKKEIKMLKQLAEN
ncbi:deoxyribonuclease IV [Tepidanaerobacter sp. GT38]|uniref:deoxyribonuclease IV n=1 Tax=Tepidanaerobacter sp. GT38 TaxID=2722793 RepID=UPI001F198BA0|nr:deoxyribonuclease IV [Tepidanaerobacter sp. GT38]MCG1011426.1 deoxyribonuclease IV [Tepidanaerobacter sp. GT38]